jgi:hypothetical protein
MKSGYTGQQFGNWTVLKQAEDREYKGKYSDLWVCRCVCGTQRILTVRQFTAKKSCGCTKPVSAIEKVGADSRTHIAWRRMRTQKSVPVCDRWKSFDNFFADMGNMPTPRLSLAIIDYSIGYAPGNCKWMTQKELMKHRTDYKIFTYKGVGYTLLNLADHTGANLDLLRKRLCYYSPHPWTVEGAVETPPLTSKDRKAGVYYR